MDIAFNKAKNKSYQTYFPDTNVIGLFLLLASLLMGFIIWVTKGIGKRTDIKTYNDEEGGGESSTEPSPKPSEDARTTVVGPVAETIARSTYRDTTFRSTSKNPDQENRLSNRSETLTHQTFPERGLPSDKSVLVGNRSLDEIQDGEILEALEAKASNERNLFSRMTDDGKTLEDVPKRHVSVADAMTVPSSTVRSNDEKSSCDGSLKIRQNHPTHEVTDGSKKESDGATLWFGAKKIKISFIPSSIGEASPTLSFDFAPETDEGRCNGRGKHGEGRSMIRESGFRSIDRENTGEDLLGGQSKSQTSSITDSNESQTSSSVGSDPEEIQIKPKKPKGFTYGVRQEDVDDIKNEDVNANVIEEKPENPSRDGWSDDEDQQQNPTDSPVNLEEVEGKLKDRLDSRGLSSRGSRYFRPTNNAAIPISQSQEPDNMDVLSRVLCPKNQPRHCVLRLGNEGAKLFINSKSCTPWKKIRSTSCQMENGQHFERE